MKTYLRLLSFLKPYVWPYFVIAVMCMIGYSATDGALPFLVQRVFDDVFQKKTGACCATSRSRSSLYFCFAAR